MNPFDSPTATPRTSLKLSGWRLRPLLPNEPCLHLPAAERTLTERHLLPVLSELEVFFLAVRRQLDPELERLQPVKLQQQKDTHFVLAELAFCATLGLPPAPSGPGRDRRHDTASLHPR